MAIITDIKQLKRLKGRFSVYVDGKYSFGISDLDLSAMNLSIGQRLDDKELTRWKAHDSSDKAMSLALRFVAVRARSRKEIVDYLERKGIADQLVAEILERMEELGLADNIAFAQAWVQVRQASSPRSRRQLWQELSAKGVSKDDISTVLEAGFDKQSELESLRSVARKKRRLPQYQDKQKLTVYLVRRGYPYDLVKRVLDLGDV